MTVILQHWCPGLVLGRTYPKAIESGQPNAYCGNWTISASEAALLWLRQRRGFGGKAVGLPPPRIFAAEDVISTIYPEIGETVW